MELVDYISNLKDTVCISSTNHTVYIKKNVYKEDISKKGGLNNEWKIRRQLKKDISRCKFHFNGSQFREIPEDLPLWVYPFCTQAVLGLPISLFPPNSMIFERSPPAIMEVDIFSGIETSIDIFKGLSCCMDNSIIDFDVHIRINELEDVSLIMFRTLNTCDTNKDTYQYELIEDV